VDSLGFSPVRVVESAHVRPSGLDLLLKTHRHAPLFGASLNRMFGALQLTPDLSASVVERREVRFLCDRCHLLLLLFVSTLPADTRTRACEAAAVYALMVAAHATDQYVPANAEGFGTSFSALAAVPSVHLVALQCVMNPSRSAWNWSRCVTMRPCGAPG
jgi:hypothetical protein